MNPLGDEWDLPKNVDRRMLNTLVDIFYLLDTGRTMQDWNQRLNNVTGYTDQEISKMDPLDFVPDEDEDKITEAIGRVLEEEEKQRVESHLVTKDGDRIPYEFTGTPFYDESDNLVGLLGTGRKIAVYKKRERTYRTELDEMYTRISDAFYSLDDEFRFTYLNPRAEELLERSEEELLGKKLWDELPETAKNDEIRNAFHRAIDEQTTQRFELYFEPLNFWISATLYPSETGISVYFRDITQRKKKERFEAQYRAMTEAANDVILTIDETSTIQSVNPPVEDLFGYKPEDLIGEKLTVLMPERFREPHEEGLQRYLETGDRTLDWDNVEIPGQHADGSEIPLSISFGEVEYGGAKYFTGIIRDITEQKEREQFYEEAKNRYEAAVEAGAVGTWEWRVPEDSMVVGERFARMFGVDPEAASKGKVELDDFLDAIHPEDQERVNKRIEDALETCGNYEAEYRVKNQEGEYRWVFARGTVHCDERGNPETFPGALTDITERKKYQQQLEVANERLEQFVYSASHDLKEPLRVARTYAEFLENDVPDQLPDDAREDIRYLQEAVGRMDCLIQSLLKLSRVGRGDVELEETPLNDCANEAIDHLAHRVEETEATIEREDLPTLNVDDTLVTDLYQNLISNALKYGGSGDTTPVVTLTAKSQGDRWILGVRDRGEGIPPEKQEEIFKPFERLKGRSEAEGTGIGLAICKRIVQSHGGKIWVESEPGDGSHFKFTLQ